MARLYDRADIYDLMESEARYKGFMQHWKTVLDGKNIHTLLDVSIGSGSVTIPLLVEKLKAMGYGNFEIGRFPEQMGKFTGDCDWYYLISQKP